MLIVVDPHSGVPAYKQLMDQVKFHVASGLLQPGDELPSTRTLSSELGLNPMTISKAYSFLEKEGVVERRPGRPLVVRALETERAKQKKIDRLREGIAPIVTMIRQLGISADEALKVIGEMLKTGSGDDPEGPRTEGTPIEDDSEEAISPNEARPQGAGTEDEFTEDQDDDEAGPFAGVPKEEI